MDVLPSFNTLTQCAFCSHLNTSFATTCELCGDLLSHTLTISVAHLMNPSEPTAYCQTCARRLLLNNRSCAFCNAFLNSTPIGSTVVRRRFPVFTASSLLPPPAFRRRSNALDTLTDTLMSVLIHDDGVSDRPLQPLLPVVRERVLQPVSTSSDTGSDQDGEERVCAVCLESLRAHAAAQLPCCRNQFHLPCLQQWFDRRSTCPLCRQNLNELDV